MCPANGELESGDAEAPVDFLCQVAHLRAYTLGVSVPEAWRLSLLFFRRPFFSSSGIGEAPARKLLQY